MSHGLDDPAGDKPQAEPEMDVNDEQEVSTSNSLALDALLSPHTSIENNDGLRSPATEFESVRTPTESEITLDDSRFSTVPLGVRESVGSDVKPIPQSPLITAYGSPRTPRESIVSSIGSRDSMKSPFRRILHKKSASTSTTPDMNGTVPFILQRLDVQKAEVESTSRRPSFEGQQRIHDELTRLHSGLRDSMDGSRKADIDWDFWGAVVSDYRQFAEDNPEKLAKAIENGIPDALRGMMWQLMAVSKDAELEAEYIRLLKESSPHEKAILRDLGRTFPHHKVFTDGQGIGQEHLFNVLKAYSLYDTSVGYCQGLPFVVAVLLLNMPDEEAFCLLVRLMQSYDLRGHFLPEMPALQLRLYQFDRLLEELLPVLHVHFLRQGVKSSMFCSQWFLTMFSYRFPLEVVFRIYDNVLATGIEAMLRFSIALLAKNEEALLRIQFDDILSFLQNKMFDPYLLHPEKTTPTAASKQADDDEKEKYDVDAFVRDAVQIKITPFMLDAYAHEYEDQLRAKEAHAIEMDSLRASNRQLLAQVKTLQSGLSELDQEHCDIVKELVMTRLKYEEMEGELVRYKLLYADAMLQRDDAQSSHRMSSFSFRSGGSGH